MHQIKLESQQGFSVVELLVVLVIIGLIITLAIPGYTSYVVRGNRTDMKSEMTQIAQRLQTYQLANRSFQGATLSTASIYGGSQYPKVNPLYNLVLTLNDTNGDNLADDWLIVANPISSSVQKNDGQISLASQGWRCWTKGSASCTPSASSVWDN